MSKKRSGNYLDLVPVRNPRNSWSRAEDGTITIHMVHGGVCDRLAQKLFRTPRVSHIRLDGYGSFLWPRIDGRRSVGQLAEELKAAFGGAAEPLYERMVEYMQILRNNRLVLFRGKDGDGAEPRTPGR